MILPAELVTYQGMADLAGAFFRARKPARSGKIRYCAHEGVEYYLDRLAEGEPCALISSGSDSLATDAIAERLPANVKRWFATNAATDNPRVTAIPIGIHRRPRRTKLRFLRKYASAPRQRHRKLLYVNFTLQHRAYSKMGIDRVGVYGLFVGQEWVTADAIKPLPQYYADMAAHDFVLSPPGCGPDCFRHWESMALGAIPVVLRSKALRILDDMPALQVDSWAEVTPERLRAELPALKKRFETQAMRKLDLAYWQEQIRNAIPS